MRTSQHRLAVAGVAVLLGGLVVAAVAFAGPTFTDPVGDATGGSPDLTQVVVSNDLTGLITFKITSVAPLAGGSLIGVDLDTDLSPANGAEYAVLAGIGGADMVKWDGKDYVDSGATILMTRSGNVLELKVKHADIGGGTRFGFAVVSVIFDESDTAVGDDAMPDGGAFTYTLTLAQCGNRKDDDGDGKVDADDFGCASESDNLESDDPVTISVGKPVTAPAQPKAGKAVVVSVAVTRAETGRGIPSGTVKCAGRAGTKVLRGVGKVAAGRASCAFKLPVGAKRKKVRGTITVTHLGKTNVVPFGFAVG